MESSWNGFLCERFEFEGRDAIIVFPKVKSAVREWALKTEYWNAFPDIEIKLLERGFHLAFVKNKTRFATKEDCDIKARFVKYISEKYTLSNKCVPIGMSCGGAHAVNFAGLYPELIQCMYIDAPFLNFCSYPGKIGNAECERVWQNEFVKAYTGIERYMLLNSDIHPICKADILIKNKIPVVLVYGTEDNTVIYEENGKLLEMAYDGTGLMTLIKVGCRGHHPHGKIGDNTEVVNAICNLCDM